MNNGEFTTMERFKKEQELGEAIANMYIAAQHINITASNAACDAMEDAPIMTRLGFDRVMSRSPYNVRAGVSDIINTRRTITGVYKPVKEEPRW